MGLFSFTLLCVLCALTYPAQCATPFSRSLNDFGLEVFKRLGGNDNLIISPTSLYVTMAMVYAGARGETRNQVHEALKIGFSPEFYMNCRHISREFTGKKDGYSLSVANGFFVQDGFSLKEGFNRVADDFKALVKNVDFASDGQQAMKVINEWAASKTGNVIKNLLKTPLNPETQLALLNAIHFKGTWKTQFNESHTQEGTFMQHTGEAVTAEFMELKDVTFDYYIDPKTGYKFLEMPYKGGHTTMILALPVDETQYPDLEIKEELLNKVTRSSKKVKMDRVVIPKFKFEYSAEFKDVLQAMGIKDLFTPGADLTGISEKGNLRVSSLFQKSAIEVNEEGSEAASVTGVVVVPTSLRPKKEFIANHPFLFYILDFNTDIILFAGRVVSP